MVKSTKEEKRSIYPTAPIAKAPMKVKPQIDGGKLTPRRTPVEALASAASLSRNDRGQFMKRNVESSQEARTQTTYEDHNKPPTSFSCKPAQYYPSNAPGTRLC